MDVAEVGGPGVVALVIDVEVLGVGFGRLVEELDPGTPGERHLEVAIEGAAEAELRVVGGGGGEEGGLERRDHTVTEAEEIAEGNGDAGLGGVIPGDEEEAFAVVRLLGHPDVGDAAGTVDVGEDAALAGGDGPGVAVAAGGVP